MKIYHDEVLIGDDSTAMHFSILKNTLVGWHNVTFLYVYNVSTDAEGYPIAEYNITLTYEFWYEVVMFYDVRIRYVPQNIGLMIGEFEVGWVKSYLDGTLILTGDISDIEKYSNYTFMTAYDIKIHNTESLHELVVKDLFDVIILNTTIDISTFTYNVTVLPIFRLGVVNLDDENHKLAVRPYPYSDGDSWQFTPILATGLFFEFWFHEGSYIFRIYSPSTYENSAGVEITTWDNYEYLLPGRLPIVIKIPMEYEGPEETETTTETNFAIIGMFIALTIISIALFKKKRKVILK